MRMKPYVFDQTTGRMYQCKNHIYKSINVYYRQSLASMLSIEKTIYYSIAWSNSEFGTLMDGSSNIPSGHQKWKDPHSVRWFSHCPSLNAHFHSKISQLVMVKGSLWSTVKSITLEHSHFGIALEHRKLHHIRPQPKKKNRHQNYWRAQHFGSLPRSKAMPLPKNAPMRNAVFRLMSPSATPATQNERRCHQVPPTPATQTVRCQSWQ